MNVKDDINYLEGTWDADRMLSYIELTTYHNIKGAIMAKQAVIDEFEKEFGYSREMDKFDRNYSYNLGILDRLKEINGSNE